MENRILKKSWANCLDECQKKEMLMYDNKLKDIELPRPVDIHQPLGTGTADLTTIFEFSVKIISSCSK